MRQNPPMAPAVQTRLFVVPGSHPSMTGRLVLEHKQIPYRRVDLIPAMHRVVVRALGFESGTVPALAIDGRRLQGTRAIARALDATRPEPPLFPAGADARRAVEEAERWGDEVLQPVPRRLTWWAVRRDGAGAGGSFLEGACLGVPLAVATRTTAPVAWLAARLIRAHDDAVRADLDALPGLLQRVDELLAEGVIGGERLNAADFQIATSVRLLMCLDDLRPALADRPAGAHAMRVAPHYPGRIPPVLHALR